LEEDERDAALVAQLDEMRTLLGRLREEDAVVGDDPHRMPVQTREGGDERRAVLRLELREVAPIDEALNDPADVVRRAGVGGHEVEQVVDRPSRLT
jgi:hypothetical protein